MVSAAALQMNLCLWACVSYIELDGIVAVLLIASLGASRRLLLLTTMPIIHPVSKASIPGEGLPTFDLVRVPKHFF